MGSLKFKDDVLYPNEIITIGYKGKEPFKAVSIFPRLFIEVLKISGKDVFPVHFKWDVTEGDQKSFYAHYMAQRTEDKWSKLKIDVTIQGEHSSKSREGWVKIWLKSWLETGYDYSNWLQKMMWFFYNRSFYYKQRRAYIEFGKDNVYQIRDAVQEVLGIHPDQQNQGQ